MPPGKGLGGRGAGGAPHFSPPPWVLSFPGLPHPSCFHLSPCSSGLLFVSLHSLSLCVYLYLSVSLSPSLLPTPLPLSPPFPSFPLPASFLSQGASCLILQLPPLSLEDNALCPCSSAWHMVDVFGHFGHKLPAKLSSGTQELP